MSSPARETRMIAASPKARLARLGKVDRQLMLLLVSLGSEKAKEALAGLCDERRERLAPLVAEVATLPCEERYALFAELPSEPKPDANRINARLRQEPPRLAALLVRELAPRKAQNLVASSAADPGFARTLALMAARWRTRPSG